MSESDDARAALDAGIDAIEAGYEFLLAYAAQGRRTDREGSGESEVRRHLGAMLAAVDELGGKTRACAASVSAALLDDAAAYFAAIDADARIAAGALRLVLARDDISSQLVDNLNASIHLRAVLTDIFLIDEALRSQRT